MSKLQGFALVVNHAGDVELIAASQEEEEYPGTVWRRLDNPVEGEREWNSLGSDAGVLSGPAVARNSDGRLEAFIVGKDRTIWHAWQGEAGRNWSEWHTLEAPAGQRLTGVPVVAQNEDGRLELFAVSDDQTLWHRWQEKPARGPWTPWHSLETPSTQLQLLDPPVVTQNHDGRLELFVTTSDGAVWYRWQTAVNNGWSGWRSLEAPAGQRVTSVPVVAQNEDGRLELFVVTNERIVWHRWQQEPARGPWAPWHSLGGEVVGFDELAVGPYADGRLILFATDRAGGVLWQREQTPRTTGWSPWKSIGEVANLGNPGMGSIECPTLVSRSNGLLELWLRLPTADYDVLFRHFQPASATWSFSYFDFLPTGFS